MKTLMEATKEAAITGIPIQTGIRQNLSGGMRKVSTRAIAATEPMTKTLTSIQTETGTGFEIPEMPTEAISAEAIMTATMISDITAEV